MTEIFVFGSNLAGRHGKGAALHARKNCGAIYGRGEGIQGRSYAIPTKDANLKTLPLDAIANHIVYFIEFALSHPELTFRVTPVGCGLAGYTRDQIKPLFEGWGPLPSNCFFSPEWEEGTAAGMSGRGEMRKKNNTSNAEDAVHGLIEKFGPRWPDDYAAKIVDIVLLTAPQRLHWFRPKEVHETVTLERAATRFGTFEAWGGGGCYLGGERLDRDHDERTLTGAKIAAERRYAELVSSNGAA